MSEKSFRVALLGSTPNVSEKSLVAISMTGCVEGSGEFDLKKRFVLKVAREFTKNLRNYLKRKPLMMSCCWFIRYCTVQD